MFWDTIKTAVKIVVILFAVSFVYVLIKGYTKDDAPSKGFINDTPGKPETHQQTTKPETTAPAPKLTFELIAGESNQYARWIVYNEGTEFEEKSLAYYVPAGEYSIKNIGDYPTQVNVYGNGKNVTADGWEEPVMGYCELLKVGEYRKLVISKDQHIEISEPTKLRLTKLD